MKEYIAESLGYLMAYIVGASILYVAVVTLLDDWKGRFGVNRKKLKWMGDACKQHRRNIGVTQEQIAKETGYSIETISGFENGRNNNATLLMWYVLHGLDAEKFTEFWRS